MVVLIPVPVIRPLFELTLGLMTRMWLRALTKISILSPRIQFVPLLHDRVFLDHVLADHAHDIVVHGLGEFACRILMAPVIMIMPVFSS